jgi:hypothetical protein
MRALFLFNDWQMDLTGYDLVICSHNYNPNDLRARPDLKPSAKLAAYVCAESVIVQPWGEPDSCDSRLHARLATDPDLLLDEGSTTAPGYVAGPTGRAFFSSYPWPKTATNARANRWDLAHTLDRAHAQAEAFAHEVADGWDVVYTDNCRPVPTYLADRYDNAGVPGWSPGGARTFSTRRSRHVLEAMLETLRELRPEPILGNTAGWTSPLLDGIAVEWGSQQPWRTSGLSQLQVLQRFQLQAEHCARNGRGIWSVDFAERFDFPGLAMAGVQHGNRPPAVQA